MLVDRPKFAFRLTQAVAVKVRYGDPGPFAGISKCDLTADALCSAGYDGDLISDHGASCEDVQAFPGTLKARRFDDVNTGTSVVISGLDANRSSK
jgi:hypothetical protein